MIRRPGRWDALVEKENDFWVGLGIVSSARSVKFKPFEKGRGLKVRVGVTAAVSLIAAALHCLLPQVRR